MVVLGEVVRSGRVVWPEAARAIFAKLRPPGCLVHVRAARLPFALMCVRSAGPFVSPRVRAHGRGRLGRPVLSEGALIRFAFRVKGGLVIELFCSFVPEEWPWVICRVVDFLLSITTR